MKALIVYISKSAWLVFAILSASITLNAQNRSSQNILPGPNKTALLVGAVNGNGDNSFFKPTPEIFIARADGTSEKFKTLGKVSFPATAAELQKRLGEQTNAVLKQLKVNSIAEAYNKLTTDGFKPLGFLLMDPKVMEALGLLYFDMDRKPDVNSTYRLTGTGINQTWEVAAGLPSYNNKFRVDNFQTSDTVLMAAWKGSQEQTSRFFLFADIYRSNEVGQTYSLVQKSILFKQNEKDTTRVLINDEVTKGRHYSYFMRVSDVAGNEGVPSDTVHLLSVQNEQIAPIRKLTVTDTLAGLLLSWEALPNSALYTSVQILKSRQLGGDYIVVDTISANQNYYLDTKIIPASLYFYKVRPLLFQLPGKSQPQFAEASGHKKVPINPGPPSAPQQVTATVTPKGVQIQWKPGTEADLFGFYVLRGTSKKTMEAIPGAIEGFQFIDSLVPSGYNGQLHYAVQAINLHQSVSDTSEMVSVNIRQAVALQPPGGVTGYRVPEGVALSWDDATKKDDRVHGFILYRKQGNGNFQPIKNQMLSLPYVTDTTAKATISYEYAVASVDVLGNQSILSASFKSAGDEGRLLAAPIQLSSRNLNAGIEIIWPKLNNAEQATTHVIYRKEANQGNYKKIGEAAAGTNSFLDTTAVRGKLYDYSVTTKIGQKEGNKTNVVSVMR